MRNSDRKHTYRDLVEGLDGSGRPIWIVQGRTAHGEHYGHRFDDRAEAEHWFRYA